MAEVVMSLPDGQEIVSAITRRSVERLELNPGDQVLAMVKATEVTVARP
jgi:molybdopterin-binding protein